MKTDVKNRPHCPCCHDRVHATDLVCHHCGADLASGAHPSAKPNPRVGEQDEGELPHGFWPFITVALVLMTVAFFIFPPAAFLMLAAAGLYQTWRMPPRAA